MRTVADPLTLDLGSDLEPDVDRAIIDMVRGTVHACAYRDDDLYMLRQQNEGVSQPGAQGPWPNSCIIEHPVSREYHMTAHANVEAACQQRPWATMEALDPNQDESAQHVESLVNVEVDLFGFSRAWSDFTYTALESRFAVMGVFYSQSVTKRKEVSAPPPVDDGTDDELDDPVRHEEQLFQLLEPTERMEFQHIDPWDFYASPVGAASVNEAEQCIVRQYKTRDALLQGIATEAYDAEAVYKILDGGPTHEPERPRADMNLLEGLQVGEGNLPGFYECFMVVGRIPYLVEVDGAPRIPERFMGEDFLFMVCPERDVVFKRTFSPFPVRPFAVASAISVPGRMIGHGIVSILSALQDEMTAIMRALIDGVNLTMNPMWMVPENWQGHYAKWSTQPGRHIAYKGNDPNSVKPVQWNLEGLQLAMEMIGMLDGQCGRLAAAQNVNSMSAGKVRKSSEVQFTQEQIQNKFGLMLGNLQRDGLAEIFRIYIATRLYHMRDKLSARQGDQSVEVTKQDLETQVRIIPTANGDNASAGQRLQTDMVLRQLLQGSPVYGGMIASGDLGPAYKLDEKTLSDMGIRNPMAYIGREPVPGDPATILQGIIAMLMSGAQKGDPVCSEMLQRVQTMNSQQQTEGPQPPPAIAASGMSIPSSPASQGQSSAMQNGVH